MSDDPVLDRLVAQGAVVSNRKYFWMYWWPGVALGICFAESSVIIGLTLRMMGVGQ